MPPFSASPKKNVGDALAPVQHPMPHVVEEALKNLGAIAARLNEEVYVKGGVACYYHTLLHLGDIAKHLALRPVSPDIDWTCTSDHIGSNKHLAILALASEQVATFTENLEKYRHITFGSKIGRGKMKLANAYVELDLIPICRFAPDQSHYMYEFGLEVSQDQTRTPGAPFEGVKLNSREVILCEKLGLGRGSDMNKFDIVDSALLLAIGPVSSSAITSVIAQQPHRDSFDGSYLPASRREAIAASMRHTSLVAEGSMAPLWTLSGSGLKQLALTARLAETLAKIDDSTLATFFTEQTPNNVRSRLQLQLVENVQLLKSVLRTAANELLR